MTGKNSSLENKTNFQIFALKRLANIEGSLSITERVKKIKNNKEDAEWIKDIFTYFKIINNYI